MRDIRIILTNNVNKTNIDGQNLEIYKFDKNESNEKELKNIVIRINKSKTKIVYLITNKEDLFEFFNRNININRKYFNDNLGFTYKQKKEDISNLKLNIEYINDSKIFGLDYILKIFKKNIEEVLFNYGNVFELDIEKLVKDTMYKVNTKEELIELISEDFNLIYLKEIITSRLCIIFYRLTYFDYDESIVTIGRYFSNIFDKSKSFNINLNKNSNGYFFTDLNNKIFRGYVIKVKNIKQNYDEFDLKINIARKLLSNGISKKIVSKSLEISEECIDLFIFELMKKRSSVEGSIDKTISELNDIELEKNLMKQSYAKPILTAAVLPKKKSIKIYS
ncbi:hypothetical protein [Aliarcobacter butzleri]|uniref:hypothetical protein n=1 Tax=Aliarcobacter butzleri TaxID=28197 RepID=UPI001EDA7952|nr:hypothetical protein [Aliarcobacter butzleri]MCG3692197.1 hypothetical protein [Aliarcobacter butzleri]